MKNAKPVAKPIITNTNPSRGYPVYRPTVSKILVCACGVRYIKTRDRQTTCVKCLVKVADAKKK